MSQVFPLLILLSILFISCDMEKEVDLVLPTKESSMVVECYLEPGEPYRLTLYESEHYFNPPGIPALINQATVIIVSRGDSVYLENKVYADTSINKIFNYVNPAIVPGVYDTDFELYIKDNKNRILRGITKILPPVKMDSLVWEFDDEDEAGPTVHFQDDPLVSNFYRFMINDENLKGDERRDAWFNDRLFSGRAVITNRPRNERGSTIYITLFHINEDYYEFLQTVEEAINSNSNPFGQPARTKSNVVGGYGIFTGLSYDRREVVVP